MDGRLHESIESGSFANIQFCWRNEASVPSEALLAAQPTHGGMM